MEKKVNGILHGTVAPPPSKSQAHRLLICAALGSSPCTISCSSINEDMAATMHSLNALGADIRYADGQFTVNPVKTKKGGVLDCGESGSTLRFLISVAAVLGAEATFVGGGKLPYRPMGDLCRVLEEHGMYFDRQIEGRELPISCSGVLRGGKFVLPGNLSSQYLTGLLFALPLAAENSEIEITGGVTSASYVNMTLEALHTAGITVEQHANRYFIPGGQHYSLPCNLAVEGDWSAAAFWIVAGVIGQRPVTVRGMNPGSLQGDQQIIEHLRSMGAYIDITPDGIVAMPSQLFGTEIDCTDTPDLVPILSVAASAAKGDTLFTNVGRLRFKESDRLAAMKSVLAAYGINATIGEDTLCVSGGTAKVLSPVSSFGDHRIAMATAVMSTLATGITTIEGAESVAKSYPAFFDDFSALGGNIY